MPLGRSLAPAVPTEGVLANAVLIEQPLGDAFLDRDLWAAGLPVPGGSPETRVLLAENGLRAVVLGGNLPPAFQKLLSSEADTVNPHALTFASRKEAVVPTVGPTDPCEYEVLTDVAGQRVGVKLRQARAGFQIRPEVGEDGQMKVWCEPQLQHGERRDWVRPTADATGFTIQGEVPLVRYPTLGFEAAIGPGDYLVIGSSAEAAGTLGAAMFELDVNGRPRQRVLVVRLGRLGTPAASDLPPIPNLRRPSIAAEAAARPR
jgi:hypothetical protein